MGAVDGRLGAAAAKQHGVVSNAQAEALGLTRRMRAARVVDGTLLVDLPGVLRVAGAPVTFKTKVATAVLSAGPGAVATHRTAAHLWSMDGFRAGVIEVAIPRGRYYRQTGVVTHESTDLDRCRVLRVDGIPLTDAGRTILDVARRASDQRVLGAMEAARRDGHVTWASLAQTLLVHARRGRPGVQRFRRVLTANVAREEITDSLMEAVAISLLLEHGLPQPILHFRVLDAAGTFVAEVDLAYPELKVAIELDGEIHRERAVFHRDRPRQNRLELLGWTVLRFTWPQLNSEPHRFVADVAAALRRARPGVV
jgi:very-short-patch-repair endonuclease